MYCSPPLIKGALLLEALPSKSDCATAIHYIFQKAFRYPLPLYLIGDMPRLLSKSGWSLLIIDPGDLRIGDLIFLKEKTITRLVSHLALAISPNQIFHFKRGGAAIESAEKKFSGL